MGLLHAKIKSLGNKACLFLIGFVALFPLICFAQDNNALHAQPWTFGQSSDRANNLWKLGVDGQAISRKNKSQDKPTSFKDKSKAKSLNSNPQAHNSQTRPKVGLEMQTKGGSWAVAPELKNIRPDEEKLRDQQHVFRAFAGVEAGEDFDISFGPELILRDDEHTAESANADQPDSALGLGMKFKLDF